MAIFLNEGFFDKIKEKKKDEEAKKVFDNLDSIEKAKLEKEYNKKIEEFSKVIQQDESKLMKDTSFVKSIRASLDSAFDNETLDPEDYDYKAYYKSKKVPKLVCNYEVDYWEILDEPQMIRDVCSNICKELAKRISAISGYKIGSGDGDEGCIYPDPFIHGFYYYWKNYIYKK